MNERTLSRQAQMTLVELRYWPLSGVTTKQISYTRSIPEPSVRRAIGELRAAGFTITQEGRRRYLKAA